MGHMWTKGAVSAVILAAGAVAASLPAYAIVSILGSALGWDLDTVTHWWFVSAIIWAPLGVGLALPSLDRAFRTGGW